MSPDEAAQIDQRRAQLAELVKKAREHECPANAGPCLGEVNVEIDGFNWFEATILLRYAIAELAGTFDS